MVAPCGLTYSLHKSSIVLRGDCSISAVVTKTHAAVLNLTTTYDGDVDLGREGERGERVAKLVCVGKTEMTVRLSQRFVES